MFVICANTEEINVFWGDYHPHGVPRLILVTHLNDLTYWLSALHNSRRANWGVDSPPK